jgi:hypothetical protein
MKDEGLIISSIVGILNRSSDDVASTYKTLNFEEVRNASWKMRQNEDEKEGVKEEEKDVENEVDKEVDDVIV